MEPPQCVEWVSLHTVQENDRRKQGPQYKVGEKRLLHQIIITSAFIHLCSGSSSAKYQSSSDGWDINRGSYLIFNERVLDATTLSEDEKTVRHVPFEHLEVVVPDLTDHLSLIVIIDYTVTHYTVLIDLNHCMCEKWSEKRPLIRRVKDLEGNALVIFGCPSCEDRREHSSAYILAKQPCHLHLASIKEVPYSPDYNPIKLSRQWNDWRHDWATWRWGLGTMICLCRLTPKVAKFSEIK